MTMTAKCPASKTKRHQPVTHSDGFTRFADETRLTSTCVKCDAPIQRSSRVSAQWMAMVEPTAPVDIPIAARRVVENDLVRTCNSCGRGVYNGYPLADLILVSVRETNTTLCQDCANELRHRLFRAVKP